MKKIFCKITLALAIIVSIGLLNFSCSDDKDFRNDGLVLVTTNSSFALLTLELSPDADATQVADFLKEHNPQVALLNNVSFDYSKNKDLVTEVAYKNSFAGQARQGYFSATESDGVSKKGMGIFVTKTFSGTSKVILDDILTLHLTNYVLPNNKNIVIASCALAKDDENLAKRQADALVKYADKISENTLISTTIYNKSPEAVNILKSAYTQSCAVAGLSNNPDKVQYVFTPTGQPWGVKYAASVKDDKVSSSEGLLLRIGLTD